MKLDKRHLIASLALLIGSIVYNVWVFTRPATGASVVASSPAPVNAAPTPSPSGTAGSVSVDPTQLKPLPDVALGRLPQWPRDPFANLRPQEPAVVEVTAASGPAPVPDPDPVVASILHSADRRLAMIDGRIVRVGDTVAGSKVIDILPNAVIIESSARGRRTLIMRRPGSAVSPQ